MSHFFKTMGVSVGVFCLFLAILEVTLRVTHLFNARISWSEPHDIYGWRFAPKAEYWNRPSEGGRSSGVINSYGWRDVEWSLNKLPGVYRVAVVGDSYVEAFQVETSETFLKIAENLLLDKGYSVEVMNFGRSGFTTTEELLVIKEEVLNFSPDLIALFFYASNDIPDVSKILAADKTRPFFLYGNTASGLYLDTSFTDTPAYKIKTLINPFKRNSTIISLATERYHLLLQSRGAGSDNGDCSRSGYLSLATANPDPFYVEAFELNKRLIRDIARIVQQRAALLLVTIDTFGWKVGDEQCLKSLDSSFTPFYYEDELRNVASAAGVYYLGLQREFRKDWEKHGRELHWGHWNYDGHRLVATLLAGQIMNIIDEHKHKRFIDTTKMMRVTSGHSYRTIVKPVGAASSADPTPEIHR